MTRGRHVIETRERARLSTMLFRLIFACLITLGKYDFLCHSVASHDYDVLVVAQRCAPQADPILAQALTSFPECNEYVLANQVRGSFDAKYILPLL